jgi:hypothetical protein
MSDDEEKTLDEVEEVTREAFGSEQQLALLNLLNYVRGLEQRLAVTEERLDELEAGTEEGEEEDEDE